MSSILIVDDEEGMRKSLSILFKREGYQIFQADGGESAVKQMNCNNIDLVVTDLRMDGMDGIGLLEHIKDKGRKIPVIIMTGYGTIESAVIAVKKGAYDYITKPFEYDEILHRAKKAIQTAETDAEMSRMRYDVAAEDGGFSMVVGKSPLMMDVKARLRKIAVNDFPVLITGETGTGKNLLARAIHLNSPRAKGPFISVNCTSIPENLFESELFGHTKGAFTSAIMERKGLFEAADGGSILLDEIGSIPKPLQAKLLGVLQDKIIRKVGSDHGIPVDVRVLAATNSDLVESVQKHEFREDLYYRINVLHVNIPPLREHKEDIPSLAQKFLSECIGMKKDVKISGFAPDVIERICAYDYPGNVRELYNIICYAVALTDSVIISSDSMPLPLSKVSCPASKQTASESRPMDFNEWEKKIIIQSIERHPRNLAEVCRELKIGRTTLWRKMKEYNIDPGSLRSVAF